MTVTGTVSSYGLTGGVPITIEEMIDLLDATELPLQNSFGADGRSALAQKPATNKKEEWQDDSLLAAVSTLSAAINTSATTLNVKTGDGSRFRTGDVIYVQSEALYVSSVATDALTVIRGFAGSTAASHATALAVICIGQALAEGSTPQGASHKDRTRRHNFTQIFGPRSVAATGTQQEMPKYGLQRGGEWMYQVDKEAMEMGQDLERALLYGRRFDDGADQRTMGGMNYFIASTEQDSTNALTKDSISDALEKVWNNGAPASSGWRLMVNMANKRKVSAIDNTIIRLDRMDNTRGEIVDYFDSDAGRVSMVLNRYLRSTDGIMFVRDQSILQTLRPWQVEPIAKTKDADTVMLLCEKTLMFKRAKWAFKFTALS